MTPDHAVGSPVRGRPRDPARDADILAAALDLVAEVGYDRVSMDAVAAACNASKATIYRRWPSKAAMVAAAVHCRKHGDATLLDTGDIRADLIAGLTAMAASIQGDDISLMVGLLGAMRTDPDLARDLRGQMVTDKRAAATAWTQRAIDRGALRPDADLDLVHEIGPALVLSRLLVTGEPVDEAFCSHLVDEVLLPLIERQAPHPSSPTERRPTS